MRPCRWLESTTLFAVPTYWPLPLAPPLPSSSQVNHLRLAVNLALDSDDGATTWGPSAVEKIQKRARIDLLE